jgi:hypothetical protein
VTLAMLVGGLLLARTVKENSSKESDQILLAVKSAIGGTSN